MTEKLRDKNVRKLTKIAKHSFSVILPIEMVEKLGWKEHQKLFVKMSGKKVIIQDWEK